MDLNDDIFIKKSNEPSYHDVKKTIPENSVERPIENNTDKIEWRWRFMKLEDDPVVEISKKSPGEKRLYFYRGDWVERNIDTYFDKYVVKEFYLYSKK